MSHYLFVKIFFFSCMHFNVKVVNNFLNISDIVDGIQKLQCDQQSGRRGSALSFTNFAMTQRNGNEDPLHIQRHKSAQAHTHTLQATPSRNRAKLFSKTRHDSHDQHAKTLHRPWYRVLIRQRLKWKYETLFVPSDCLFVFEFLSEEASTGRLVSRNNEISMWNQMSSLLLAHNWNVPEKLDSTTELWLQSGDVIVPSGDPRSS